MVKRALEALTEGKIPVELHRPELAVSYGAARYAAGIAGEQKKLPDGGQVKAEQSSNIVLEQLTAKGYGLWVPSQRLGGEVRILIPVGVRLPYTAQPIRLRTGSGGLTLRVECTRGGACAGDTAAVKDCRELIRLPFRLRDSSGCLSWIHGMPKESGGRNSSGLPPVYQWTGKEARFQDWGRGRYSAGRSNPGILSGTGKRYSKKP